jgi:hypothetical protein
MKKLVTFAAIIAVFVAISGCKKDGVVEPQKATTDTTHAVNFNGSSLMLTLSKGSPGNVQSDQNALVFNSAASYDYSPAWDARYLQGTGEVGLCILSYDHPPVEEAVVTLPFQQLQDSTKNGPVAIPFEVQFNLNGSNTYFLSVDSIKGHPMPAGAKVWIKDVAKDSTFSVSPGHPYSFKLSGNGPVQYPNRFNLLLN